MRRTLFIILGIVAATAAHAQAYTPVEYVLTGRDPSHAESQILEIQRSGYPLHLAGEFSLPQFVRGSQVESIWDDPFKKLTDYDKQYHVIPFDVSGSGPSGYHYWAKLDTEIQSGHQTWYGPNGEVMRYGIWEFEIGTARMVIVP